MTPIKHVYWPPLKKGTNAQDLSSSPESEKKIDIRGLFD